MHFPFSGISGTLLTIPFRDSKECSSVPFWDSKERPPVPFWDKKERPSVPTKKIEFRQCETQFPLIFSGDCQADNTFLPFARLAARTFLPFAVLILALKP